MNIRILLVRHRVRDVVDPDAESERGVLFRILGVVGVLPGIAQVHVVADGDHEAAFVVVDAAPVGDEAVFLVDAVRVDELLAGHLVAIIQVEDGVEDRIVLSMSTMGRSGKTRRMPARKMVHSSVPWKSSHMKNPPRSRKSRSLAACESVRAQWPTSTP